MHDQLKPTPRSKFWDTAPAVDAGDGSSFEGASAFQRALIPSQTIKITSPTPTDRPTTIMIQRISACSLVRPRRSGTSSQDEVRCKTGRSSAKSSSAALGTRISALLRGRFAPVAGMFEFDRLDFPDSGKSPDVPNTDRMVADEGGLVVRIVEEDGGFPVGMVAEDGGLFIGIVPDEAGFPDGIVVDDGGFPVGMVADDGGLFIGIVVDDGGFLTGIVAEEAGFFGTLGLTESIVGLLSGGKMTFSTDRTEFLLAIG